MIRDLWDSVRQWQRTPVVTTAALLSLTLGIGANTAIFSVLNGLIFKSLPLAQPEQIVSLRTESRPLQDLRISYPMFESLAREPANLAGLAAYASEPVDLAGPGEPTQNARGLFVSGSYFSLLGVGVAHGRVFTRADDDSQASGLVAVISHAFWQRHFGGAPNVVGLTMPVANRTVEIVGIADHRFLGLDVGKTFDVALPLAAYRTLYGTERFRLGNLFWLSVVGRLTPDQPIASAQAALAALQPAVIAGAQLPENVAAALSKARWWLVRTADTPTTGARTTYQLPLLVLMGIVALVLAVACANVANLLVARAGARRAEFAVRLSLGSSRSQLIRQLAIEAAALAIVGATVGIAVGAAGGRGLVWLLSTSRDPIALDLTFDWRIALFAMIACGITALASTVLPAWRATRIDPVDALRAGARGIATGRSRFGAAQIVIAAQVALTFLLVLGGLSFTQSFVRLTMQERGFDRARVQLVGVGMRTAKRTMSLSETALQLSDRLRAVPGVDDVAFSWSGPFGMTEFLTYASVTGPWLDPNYFPPEVQIRENTISPNYFSVMGMRLLAGRGFDGLAERADRVVVNAAFVKRFLSTGSPVGQMVWIGLEQTPLEVIGVVNDTKFRSLRADPPAIVYLPWLANARQNTGLRLSVRSAGFTPSSMDMAQAIDKLVPGAKVEVRSLDGEIADTLAIDRATATLAACFGVLALLLSAIGVYGVLAHDVHDRTPEIGVRTALGAGPARIVRMVVGQTAVVMTTGIAAGAGLAAAAGRYIQSLLYAVTPTDPWLIGWGAALFVSVAFFAALIPTRRAVSVDPMIALRHE